MGSTIPSTNMTAKLYTQKQLVLLEISITYFNEYIYIYRQYQNWHLVFYMCKSQVSITVAKNTSRHLSKGESYTMFCVGIIMQCGQYPVFLTKQNPNNMKTIGLQLLNGLHQRTLVHQDIPIHCWQHVMCYGMQCLTPIFLMTANMILQPHPHTKNKLLNFCKIDSFFLQI